MNKKCGNNIGNAMDPVLIEMLKYFENIETIFVTSNQ